MKPTTGWLRIAVRRSCRAWSMLLSEPLPRGQPAYRVPGAGRGTPFVCNRSTDPRSIAAIFDETLNVPQSDHARGSGRRFAAAGASPARAGALQECRVGGDDVPRLP